MKIIRRSGTDRIFRAILFFIIVIFALSYLYIFLWMFFNSLRTGVGFARKPFALFDLEGISLNNYKEVFSYTTGRNQTNVLGMLKNSFILIIGCTALTLFLPSTTGYVFAKFQFRGSKVMVNIIIITMVVPTVGALSTTYKFINDIGLYDNFLGIFLLNASGFGFNFLLFKNFFAGVPTEYKEAAYLDGAGNLKTYLIVMFPQAKPLLLSTAIMTIIGSWNDFFTPYLYLPSYPTMALGVNNIYISFVKQGQNYPIIFAAMTFTAGIVLVIYAFFSKTIVTSMSAGGLKA